jgi:lipopolysaccharide heptosyltransferase II
MRRVDPLWRKAKKILCVRLDSLGDVIMTTPAIRALKESIPGCQINLLTSPSGAQVVPLVSEVDEVIIFEAPWMKATMLQENSQSVRDIVDLLRQEGFDAAVIFTVYSQNPLPSALMCYLAEIPLRLAYCRENPYQLLTHWMPELEPDKLERHEVRRHLDLVGVLGVHTEDERMQLLVTETAQEQVQNKLTELGVDRDKPLVIIHPGASAPSRRYPPERFAEVARKLALDHHHEIVFTGSTEEQELVTRIQRKMAADSISLAGRLELDELAALISDAQLLISNNTGPVHVAAALNTPVVDLYALTNPQHTPWGVPNRVLFHDVPCKFCYKSVCPEGHHNCLRLVNPDDVVMAAIDLLAETSVKNQTKRRSNEPDHRYFDSHL